MFHVNVEPRESVSFYCVLDDDWLTSNKDFMEGRMDAINKFKDIISFHALK